MKGLRPLWGSGDERVKTGSTLGSGHETKDWVHLGSGDESKLHVSMCALI